MDMEFFHLQVEPDTKDNSKRIWWMEKVFINIQMVINIVDIGKKIKDMEKECLNG